jgi:DMSO/TMAO reductase YedYZ heme-binding membrane subunit
VGVAFGIVALYLLAAVEVTSLARERIPTALWRRVHFLSFPLYLLTTVHLLSAGTDRHNPALLLTVAAVTAAVVALVAVRVRRDLAGATAPARGTVPRRSTPPDRVPTRGPVAGWPSSSNDRSHGHHSGNRAVSVRASQRKSRPTANSNVRS